MEPPFNAPPTGARRHQCPFCPRRFVKLEHLHRHCRIHTGSRPFECLECEKRFGRQDTLARHTKLHQKSPSTNTLPSQVQDPSPKSRTKEVQNAGLVGIDEPARASAIDKVTSQPVDHVPASQNDIFFDPDSQWQGTDDLLELLMADPAVWSISIPVLHSSPFSEELQDTRTALSVGANDSLLAGRGQQAMQQLKRSIQNLSLDVVKDIEQTNVKSDFLETCVNMFFSRFISAFPVLHAPSYVARECDPSLLLNIIALGSLFISGDDAIAKGEALWRLAHTAVSTSWESLLEQKGPKDSCPGMQLVLTAFLGQTYAMLSKNRDLRSISHTYHTMGFQWARKAGLFDEASKSSYFHLQSEAASPEEKDEHWRNWLSTQVLRRGILGHYVLDGLLTQLSGQPTAVRHTGNRLPLPCADRVFNARSADEWIAEMQRTPPTDMTFREVYLTLFHQNTAYPEPQLSYLSIRVILEGLQSVIYDSREANGFAVGVPHRADICQALLKLHAKHILSLPTQAEIVEHEIRWHVICSDLAVDTAMLNKQICALYGFKQEIQRCGTRDEEPIDFSCWLDSISARKGLLHAIAISKSINGLPIGRLHCVHLPTAIFTAATIYTAALVNATQLNHHPIILVPDVVSWPEVWQAETYDNFSPASDATAFLTGNVPESAGARVRLNLLHDLHMLQTVLSQISAYWGIAHEMSQVIKQWITIPTLPEFDPVR